MRKRKNQSQTLTPPNLPPEPIGTNTPQQVVDSKKFSYTWWVLAALAASIFLTLKHIQPWGRVCLGIAIVLQCLSWLGINPKCPKGPRFSASVKSTGLVLILWAAFSLLQLSFPSFSWIFPPIRHLFFSQTLLVLAFVWIALIFALKKYPDDKEGTDFSPNTARILLFMLILSGIVLRFLRGYEPMGSYWDDESLEIIDARRVLDFGDFNQAFVFPSPGNQEPFLIYLNVLLWKIAPHLTCLQNQRISCILVDVCTIIVLYFAGKELKNRRTGIWAAALGAIGKVLTMKSLQGMRIMTISLGVGLTLLFTFRLFKKPNLTRFLQWGAAFAFGTYTYSTFRSDVPFFLLGVLAWILLTGLLDNWPKHIWSFLAGTGLLYAVFILYTNNVFKGENWIKQSLNFGGFLFPALLLAFYLLLASHLIFKEAPPTPQSGWLGWLIGSWFGVLLVFPFLADSTLSGKLAASLHFGDFFTRLAANAPLSVILGFGVPGFFSYRLKKSPSLKGYLALGIAVAIAAALFPSRAALISLLLLTPLPWVLKSPSLEPKIPGLRALLIATGLLLFTFFLYMGDYLGSDSFLSWLVDFNPLWMPCWVLALFFLFTLVVLKRSGLIDPESRWFGWLSGSWFFVLLSFPVMADQSIMARIGRTNPTSLSGLHYLAHVWQQTKPALLILFWSGFDRSDMFLPNDALFGFTEVILIAFGLAWFVARPSWIKAFLTMSVVMGLIPFIGTDGPHTGRLLGAAVPLLLIGAVGFDRFSEGLASFHNKKLWRAFLISVVILGGWTAYGSAQRIYNQWMFRFFEKHVLYRGQALEDMHRGMAVFITNSLGGGSAPSVIFENQPIHYWKKFNRIYLSQGEKPKDVVLYMEYSDHPDEREALRRFFPEARWTEFRYPTQNPQEDPIVVRCLIPCSEMLENRFKNGTCGEIDLNAGPWPLLQFCDMPTGPTWHRQFSSSYSGLSFGVIDWEDWVSNINAAIGPGISKDQEAVRYLGTIHVSKAGTYDVDLKVESKTVLKIDGREIFNSTLPRGNRLSTHPYKIHKTVKLDGGNHPVEVVSVLVYSDNAPDIRLKPTGTKENDFSLWTLPGF